MKKLIISAVIVLATTGVCFADDYTRQMDIMRYRQQQRSIQADINRQNEFNRMQTENRLQQQQSEINILRSRQNDLIQPAPMPGLPQLPGLPNLMQ
jgi:hypothetical protein